MDLLSFFRRRAPTAPTAPAARGGARPAARPDAPVAEARTRARRRLIGAVVLLGIGVVAFPLLFETEPRPIPVDLPIEVPRKEGLPPLVVPPPGGGASRSGRVEPGPAPSTAGEPAAETVAPQTTDAPTTSTESAPGASETPPREGPREPAPSTAERVAPPPAPATARPAPPPSAAPAADGARAKALLEGKTAAPAGAPRFVVQVGAFADANAVRDVRAKVERLGLKTYTQVVHVAAGDRTRVRVGPFDQREQADAALAQLKKAGFAATVMTQ
jgi:DedD protein